MQVDALLSETGVMPDKATAYDGTVSGLSEVLLGLPDMQVGATAVSPHSCWLRLVLSSKNECYDCRQPVSVFTSAVH